MPYDIVVHELAATELAAFRVFDQRRILAEIRGQLANTPTAPTRRRKCLIDLTPSFEHGLPVWELRIGSFRVFTTLRTTSDECIYEPYAAKKPRRKLRISHETHSRE